MDPNSVLTLIQIVQIIITTLVAVGALLLSYWQWKKNAKKVKAETTKAEVEAAKAEADARKAEDTAQAEAAEALANAGETAAKTYKNLIETLNERLVKAESDIATYKDIARRMAQAEVDFQAYRKLTDQRIADLNQQIETLSRQLILKQDTIDQLTAEVHRMEEVIEGQQGRITELETENRDLHEKLNALGGQNASTN